MKNAFVLGLTVTAALVVLTFVTQSFADERVDGTAAECPAPEDHSGELRGLIAKAQGAKNFMAGRGVSGEMWLIYLRAPDAAAQKVLDAGMRHRDSFNYAAALEEFNELVRYCADYAEGWNQRAYIHFLREDYAKALPDLDRAIVLNPYHVAALSGRALTLMNMGRLKEARVQMIEAVEMNPWLSERALLADGGPLAIPGKDI